MAPPTWVRLYHATGDRKYVSYLDEEWAKTYPRSTTKTPTSTRATPATPGRPKRMAREIFWCRGEGWVMAGLARTLEFLPKDDPAAANYKQQMHDMAAALAKLQRPDGLGTSASSTPRVPRTRNVRHHPYHLWHGLGHQQRCASPQNLPAVVTKAWAGMFQHISTPTAVSATSSKRAPLPQPTSPPQATTTASAASCSPAQLHKIAAKK